MKKNIISMVLCLHAVVVFGASGDDRPSYAQAVYAANQSDVRSCADSSERLVFDRANLLALCSDPACNAEAKKMYHALIDDQQVDPLVRVVARMNIASGNIFRGINCDETVAALSPIFLLRDDAGIHPDVLHAWQIHAGEFMAHAYAAEKNDEKILRSLCYALGIAHNNGLHIETQLGNIFPAHRPETVTALVSLLQSPSIDEQFNAWLKASELTKREQADFEGELFALAESYGSKAGTIVRVKRALLRHKYADALALCETASLPPESLALIKNHWLCIFNSAKDKTRFEAAYGVSLCESDPKKAEVYLTMAAGQGVHGAQEKLCASAQAESDPVKQERWFKILADSGSPRGTWGYAKFLIENGRRAQAEPYIEKGAKLRWPHAELEYAMRGDNLQDKITRLTELEKRKNFPLRAHVFHALGLVYKRASDQSYSKETSLSQELARRQFNCSVERLKKAAKLQHEPSIITLSTLYIEIIQHSARSLKPLPAKKIESYRTEAYALLEDLLKREPHNLKAWLNISAFHIFNDNKQAAIDTFIEAFKSSMTVGDDKQAAVKELTAVKESITDFFSILYKGKNYSLMKDLALKMLEVRPEYPEALMHLGNLAQNVDGNPREALGYYERAGEQGYGTGWKNAGQLYMESEDAPTNWPKARDCFVKSLIINPKSADVWFSLATVYELLNEGKLARQAWYEGAELGHVDSIVAYAHCCRIGHGGAYAPGVAVGLYQKAKELYLKESLEKPAHMCALLAAVTANQACPVDTEHAFQRRVADLVKVEEELLTVCKQDAILNKEVLLALGLRYAALAKDPDCPGEERAAHSMAAKVYFWQTLDVDDEDPRGLYHLVIHTMAMLKGVKDVSQDILRYIENSFERIISCYEELREYNNDFLINACNDYAMFRLQYLDNADEKGRELFLKAAEKGSVYACYNLACYYLNRSSEGTNLDQALCWINKVLAREPTFDNAQQRHAEIMCQIDARNGSNTNAVASSSGAC